MTIAAGFLCKDGIVICADREVTTDFEKYEESKIFTVNSDSDPASPMAVIAGSGWLNFVKMTVDMIREQAVFASSAQEIKQIARQVILKVHRQNIRYFPENPKPYFDLIIGIRDQTGLTLLKTERTSMNQITEFTCMGIGDVLANYLSRALNPHDETAEEAALLAVQILDQVKRNVPGCGGLFSEVAILPRQGKTLRVSPSRLLDIEYRARDFAPLLKPLLMAISNPVLSDEDFDATLADLAEQCRTVRLDSQERMRRANAQRRKS